MPPDLWTLTVRCDPSIAEALGAALEEDAAAVTVLAPPRVNEATVEAIYAFKPDKAALEARLAIIAALSDAKPPVVALAPVGNLDWLKKVAADYPPFTVERWTIYGSAHRAAVRNRRMALEIDASTAFGTGEHPTTRACLILLEDVLKRYRPTRSLRILDMGCGSGILAMAAARAHPRAKILAVDCDAEATRVARDNVRRNGLGNRIRVAQGNGYRTQAVQSGAPYDLILANILAGPLCAMAGNLARALAPGGNAILSGILLPQAVSVLASHRAHGLTARALSRHGEWSGLLIG